jgi:hypothetical protein
MRRLQRLKLHPFAVDVQEFVSSGSSTEFSSIVFLHLLMDVFPFVF